MEYLEQATRRGVALDASQGLYSRIMAKRWTPEYRDTVVALKRLLDPNNIMNPGLFSL
jgi:FAD/FMN-containing dehydrogenase